MNVSDSLSICEHNKSFSCDVLDSTLLHDDNVLIVYEKKLIDPIDDQIESTNKVDLCSPSVGTCTLNEGTQLRYKSNYTLVDPCDDQGESPWAYELHKIVMV